jgi:outer membrane protein TolC
VRHSNAASTAQIEAKETSETAAVGTQTASFTDTYQQLLAERTSYEAAMDAYASAEISYNTLQLKKKAGMLSEADYLTGEASYLEALAQKETASMNLYQAYQDYQWELIGLGNSQSQGGR